MSSGPYLTQAEALEQAAADIWLSIRRYGHPDRVNFSGWL